MKTKLTEEEQTNAIKAKIKTKAWRTESESAKRTRKFVNISKI